MQDIYANFAPSFIKSIIVNNFESLDPKEYILIKGARQHNLKNISMAIPRNKFVVVTGLSGSGKSSLAFDTLYAEGQRRYVESLSAYARQFFGKMTKPNVDYIKGISPAIAIEQKVNSRNPRSTVGTSSEIYEYLKLLYARIGQTISPVSGNIVKRESVTDVVDFITTLAEGTRIAVYAPLKLPPDRSISVQAEILLQQGFTRLRIGKELKRIEDISAELQQAKDSKNISILLDRLAVKTDDAEFSARVADSVQTAFFEGHGECILEWFTGDESQERLFTNRFEADGINFEEPTVNLFTFNNPYGACKRCEGFGTIIGIDEDLVIPDKNLSIYEEAVACWKGEKMSDWKDAFIHNAGRFGFPVHRPYSDLDESQKKLLWQGTAGVEGIDDFFTMVEQNLYKIQYRVMLSRYRGRTVCPDCKGARLRKDAGYVKVNGLSIHELVNMPIDTLYGFFNTVKLQTQDQKVAERILIEIKNRLKVLNDVGLGYLTLNRLSNSLSGGESQRLNLATSLGSSLVGSMYILDEPSIGLHPRDTNRLIDVLRHLRDVGNTVIVVEHDEEIIRAADQVIDIGPNAGYGGGELVFQGNLHELLQDTKSYTGKYLSGVLKIALPLRRRKWKEFVEIEQVTENNLKNISVKFPLHILTAVTGVSGSGKTSLVKGVLYPALKKIYGGYGEKTGHYGRLSGDYRQLEDAELIDQNPIGRSTRSNPATYVGAWDEIRSLYAEQPLAVTRGYKPGYFSFNVAGGRCEECEGEGFVSIEMQFMADIKLLCDSCKGKRFKDELLDVKVDDKSISDILDMTIDQAVEHFNNMKGNKGSAGRIANRLLPLQEVGLGYLKLGQSSSTLSGGEAQRVKLAFFLSKGQTEKSTLFIFDEPTTGLHFHDITRLMSAFNALIDKGHTIIVIEHNPEIIKSADWVIDLGPEGGNEGGNLVFEGTPEALAKCKVSYTGKYLKAKV
ncbi:MAG TPA: excinuclease ABC subunit A [Bacteroidales bacterium]|nr:MAG: excinuclease ABC subunit A [Bacteroidetes bacterium HGW-Bacteroidetes-22]HBZ66338.1 excinuclease ABC subunit A [Bacteroidales bacterium]